MAPAARRQWILEYLVARQALLGTTRYAVDVLDAEFVGAYIEATGAPCKVMPYGADKCRQLGLDLAAMHKTGVLRRHRTSIEGLAGMGFPTWVYSYYLPPVTQ